MWTNEVYVRTEVAGQLGLAQGSWQLLQNRNCIGEYNLNKTEVIDEERETIKGEGEMEN